MTIAFTVLTPCLNGKRYLPETATVLAKQTHSPAEWLFVDNGSTDGSPQYIESIAPHLPFPVRVLHEPRRGPSAARNRGIQEARTEWIAFLDSDDLWLPEKLQRQAGYLQAHPETDFLFTDAWQVDSNGRPLKCIGPFPLERTRLEQIFLDSIIRVSSVVVRRRCLIEEEGFREDTIHSEDLELWLRVLATNRMGYMPEPLSVKRTHPESLIATPQHYADTIQLGHEIAEKIPILAPWRKRQEAMAWCNLGRRYHLLRGEHAQARAAFAKAIRRWPSLAKAWRWWILSWLSPAQIRRLLERFEFRAVSQPVPEYTLPIPVPPFDANQESDRANNKG